MSEEHCERLLYDWRLWAREKQIAPDSLDSGRPWRTWLILAGRGFGKTRTVNEWVRQKIEDRSGRRGALIARTAADARDVMVEGESGLLNICPPSFRPVWIPSKRRLVWPNGGMVTTYSAEKPDMLRGPQHDFGACDELASWRYDDAWSNFMFGLRLGKEPQVAVATTPRPTARLKKLMHNPTTLITRGTTYENASNLAEAFMAEIITEYEGTRLGRQELNAEILEDTPGALWTHERIEANRVTKIPDLKRIVIGVDPSASNNEGSAETGVIVAGVDNQRIPHAYILADLSVKGSPDEWSTRVIQGFEEYECDRIVAEANNGGDMITAVITMTCLSLYSQTLVSRRSVPVTKVHATRGKYTRAEPISALYEQSRVHHVGGLAELEDQMCNWVPGEKSPDRMDALVWALTDLMVDGRKSARLHTW